MWSLFRRWKWAFGLPSYCILVDFGRGNTGIKHVGSASADFYGRRPHSNPSCWPSSLPIPGSRRVNEQIFAPPLSTRQVCSSHRQIVFRICFWFCTCQTLLSQYLSDSTKISTNSDMAMLSTFHSTDILHSLKTFSTALSLAKHLSYIPTY